MDGMKEREEAFEKKYAHDEELRFKAEAHRNRMIGLWAADQLGKTGATADDYAKTIIDIALEHGKEDDVVLHIFNDLKAANINIKENELRIKMTQLLQESLDLIQNQ